MRSGWVSIFAIIDFDEVQAIADLIERQQAIIDKLPKTADGVPMTPGMEVFHRNYYPTGFVRPLEVKVPHYAIEVADDTWYSTREAAEKARKR